jgi:hypothetical protein
VRGLGAASPPWRMARTADVLRIRREQGIGSFTRQTVWQQTKRRLQTAAAYDKCTAILENRGYLKQCREAGPSGRAQTVVELNPLWTKPPLPADKRICSVQPPRRGDGGVWVRGIAALCCAVRPAGCRVSRRSVF